MLAMATGFSLGFGLIISLGPQNLFLIKQSIRRDRHIECAILCWLCDVVLIVLSCLGLGYLIMNQPIIQDILLILGSAFLVVYGARSLRSGLRGFLHPHSVKLEEQTASPMSLQKLVLMTLSFSLLNPQAIVDTMIIVGGAAVEYQGSELIQYACGVILASLCWFVLITALASQCSYILKKPFFWSLLEVISAIIMASVAWMLVHTLMHNLGFFS